MPLPADGSWSATAANVTLTTVGVQVGDPFDKYTSTHSVVLETLAVGPVVAVVVGADVSVSAAAAAAVVVVDVNVLDVNVLDVRVLDVKVLDVEEETAAGPAAAASSNAMLELDSKVLVDETAGAPAGRVEELAAHVDDKADASAAAVEDVSVEVGA